jgi:hypothetical protein
MRICIFVFLMLLCATLSAQDRIGNNSLSIQALPPAFLIQGDHIEFAVRIMNNSGKECTGQVQLELLDSLKTSVDGWFINTFPNQYFTVDAHRSGIKRFPIQVPYNFERSKLGWEITARVDSITAFDQGLLPIWKASSAVKRKDQAVRAKKECLVRDRNTHKWTQLYDRSSIHIGDTVRVRILVKALAKQLQIVDHWGACFEWIAHLDNSRFDHSGPGYISWDKIEGNKGTYALEYRLVASQVGTFGSGLTTVLGGKDTQKILYQLEGPIITVEDDQ